MHRGQEKPGLRRVKRLKGGIVIKIVILGFQVAGDSPVYGLLPKQREPPQKIRREPYL